MQNHPICVPKVLKNAQAVIFPSKMKNMLSKEQIVKRYMRISLKRPSLQEFNQIQIVIDMNPISSDQRPLPYPSQHVNPHFPRLIQAEEMKRLQITQFFANIIYNFATLIQSMFQQAKYPLSAQTESQQTLLLSKSAGLYELFDKFQCLPLFTVPQNSVVVDLENITFGPSRYSIRLQDKEDLFFKIVYYCILQFIFEKADDARNAQAYEKVLHFIINNEIELPSSLEDVSQEEAKIYLVKFLNILEKAKCKRKVVIEELNNLPQISALLVALVKQAGRHNQLFFQQNAREVQRNIANAFGIEFDLLSCDLFLFAQEFKVEIRHLDSACEFAVTHQKPETIQRIKEEFYMGESAYFMAEQPALNGFESSFRAPKSNIKVTKKDTVMSIDWVQSDNEVEDKEPDTSCQAADPEDVDDLCVSQQIEESFVKGKSVAELFCTQDRTLPDSTETPSLPSKPRILNFEEIIRQESQGVPLEPPQTVRSTKNHRQGLQLFSTSTSLRLIGKPHKPSFCCSDLSLSFVKPWPVQKHMSVSKSLQEIRLPRDQGQSSRIGRKERRVPTFILNRAKQHPEKVKITPQEAPAAPAVVQISKAKVPRITFTYTTK